MQKVRWAVTVPWPQEGGTEVIVGTWVRITGRRQDWVLPWMWFVVARDGSRITARFGA